MVGERRKKRTPFEQFYWRFTRAINHVPDVPDAPVKMIRDEGGDSRQNLLQINAENSAIAKLLECPVCYDIVVPPITLCSSGHSVCNYCRDNLRSCPECRGPFTAIRNRFAENFLDMCLIQCKYKDSGCQVKMSGRELSEHHKFCDFRPLICPTCEREIPYHKYLEHLRNEEKLETQTATECSTGFEIEDDEVSRAEAERFSVWEPTWIHAYERDFFCYLETMNSHWWLWVGLFGTAEDCKDFICTITIWNKEKKTELKYVGKVHPIRATREEVFQSGQCLIFLEVNLKNYMYKGGIDVLVRIDRDYVAPITRKGLSVESPVTLFSKGFNGIGESSRANRLNKSCNARNLNMNNETDNETNAINSEIGPSSMASNADLDVVDIFGVSL